MEINEEVKINSRVYTIKSVGKTKAILECEGKTFPVAKDLLERSLEEGKSGGVWTLEKKKEFIKDYKEGSFTALKAKYKLSEETAKRYVTKYLKELSNLDTSESMLDEEVKINSKVYTVKSKGKTKVILECEGKTYPVSRDLLADSLDESSIDEGCKNKEMDEELKIGGVKVTDNGLVVNINGKDYTYTSDSYNPDDLYKKYMGIAKHSAGKAIAWLKKNAKTSNSYKQEKG